MKKEFIYIIVLLMGFGAASCGLKSKNKEKENPPTESASLTSKNSESSTESIKSGNGDKKKADQTFEVPEEFRKYANWLYALMEISDWLPFEQKNEIDYVLSTLKKDKYSDNADIWITKVDKIAYEINLDEKILTIRPGDENTYKYNFDIFQMPSKNEIGVIFNVNHVRKCEMHFFKIEGTVAKEIPENDRLTLRPIEENFYASIPKYLLHATEYKYEFSDGNILVKVGTSDVTGVYDDLKWRDSLFHYQKFQLCGILECDTAKWNGTKYKMSNIAAIPQELTTSQEVIISFVQKKLNISFEKAKQIYFGRLVNYSVPVENYMLNYKYNGFSSENYCSVTRSCYPTADCITAFVWDFVYKPVEQQDKALLIINYSETEDSSDKISTSLEFYEITNSGKTSQKVDLEKYYTPVTLDDFYDLNGVDKSKKERLSEINIETHVKYSNKTKEPTLVSYINPLTRFDCKDVFDGLALKNHVIAHRWDGSRFVYDKKLSDKYLQAMRELLYVDE